MSFPILRRGDEGEEVFRLQSQLNKVGAMLIADGDFGPATERGVSYAQDIAQQPATGIADEVLWHWLAPQPEPFPLLNTNGLAFIANEETGGLSYYDLVTRWPHYPGHSSGITIGVGYDLRFNSESNFTATWGDYLPRLYFDELLKDIGKRGTKSRAKELKRMGIEVPFKAAWPVFIELTLSRFYRSTESIYPSLSKLPDLCRSVLVSIVFNRGTDLTGSRRKEMKEIQNILSRAEDETLNNQQQKQVLMGIEDQILSMKRLWESGSGLIKRRQAEANLWRKGLMNL